MPNIDYSKLSSPKKPSPYGHSVKGSFYLQKTKEIPGRYKPFSRYDTTGTRITVVDTPESPTELFK